MTVGSTLLTVVLAAIAVAAFAADPLILAVTLAVSFVTLTFLARRLGRELDPPSLHTPPDLPHEASQAAEGRLESSGRSAN